MNSIRWVSLSSYSYFLFVLRHHGPFRARDFTDVGVGWTGVCVPAPSEALVLFSSVCVFRSGCIRPAVFASFHVCLCRRTMGVSFDRQPSSGRAAYKLSLHYGIHRNTSCGHPHAKHFLENATLLPKSEVQCWHTVLALFFFSFLNKYTGFCLHQDYCDKITKTWL